MDDKKNNFTYKPLGFQSKPAPKGLASHNKNQTLWFKKYADPESITLKEYVKLENKAYPDANFNFKFPPKKQPNLKASIKKSQYTFLGQNQNYEDFYEAQTLKYIPKQKIEAFGQNKQEKYQNENIVKKKQELELVFLEKSIIQKIPQKHTFEKNLNFSPVEQNPAQKLDFEIKNYNYQAPIIQTPKNDLIYKKKTTSIQNFDEKNYNDSFSTFTHNKIKSEQILAVNQPYFDANNKNEVNYPKTTENPIQKFIFNNPPPQKQTNFLEKPKQNFEKPQNPIFFEETKYNFAKTTEKNQTFLKSKNDNPPPIKTTEESKQNSFKISQINPKKYDPIPQLAFSTFLKGGVIYLTRIFSADLLKLQIAAEPLKVKIIGDHRIAAGVSSDVFLGEIVYNDKLTGELISTNKLVALKRFKGKEGRLLGESEKNNLEKLLRTKSLQNNPNFCQLLGYTVEEAVKEGEQMYSYTIALEYGKQTLYELIRKKKEKKGKPFTLDEIKQFAEAMIFIFSSFQKIGLYYRDIKPANVLLTPGILMQKIDKIIDFDVSLWLDTIQTNDGEYAMGLAGTPMYMSPELYKVYCDLYLDLKKPNLGKPKKDKVLMTSNLEDQLQIPNELATVCDDNKTLIITKKQLKFKDGDDITNNIVCASDCFKNDVFSLGLTILEMVFANPGYGKKIINVKYLNRRKQNLEEALAEFIRIPKNANFIYLNDLIQKMMAWKQEDRADFIELEDYLVYERMVDIGKKYNYVDCERKFTSLGTFHGIWDMNPKQKFKKAKDHFFSAGYLCTGVDFNFIKTIIDTSYEKNLKKKMLSEEISSHQQNFAGGSNLKVLSEGMVKTYTLENEFYIDINKCLGKNQVGKYKYYLTNFLKIKKMLNTPIVSKTVYRVISLENMSDRLKFEARSRYFPGIDFSWPSFTSTTKSEFVKDSWIKMKSKNKNASIILFIIKIKNDNLSNKADISINASFDEQEVLLFPYFHFKVIKNAPCLVKVDGFNRTICQIEVEEMQSKVLSFKIIWFDPGVNSAENKIIQNRIRQKYGELTLETFDDMGDAVTFLKNYEMVSIVISCGGRKEKLGERFVDKIHDLNHVSKILIYAADLEYHKKWAGKYEKVLDVFNESDELIEALPDKDILY